MFYANARYNYFHSYTEDLPPHLDHRLRRAYRDTVRSIDRFVERLTDDLISDNPVTVIHADHGEAFQEHGTLGHRPQLYRENVHVPLLMHGLELSSRVTSPTPLRSLPTLITDVADCSLNPTEIGKEFVLTRTEEGERLGVRSPQWSYQTSADGWEYVHGGERDELYNLAVDSIESENVADTYPSIAEVLNRLISHHKVDQQERKYIAEAVADAMI
jgi:arylsulfatase